MGLFNTDNQNQENQEKTPQLENPNAVENQEDQSKSIKFNEKIKFKGKFINLKFIKIGLAALVVVIIYNIFSTGNKKEEIKPQKQETIKQTTPKENPYNTTYSDVRDIGSKENTIIENKNTTNQNNTQQVQKQEIDQAQQDKIRQLEEQALQAKKSPISFQIYSANKEKQQQNDNNNNNNYSPDYDQNRQNSKKDFLFNESQKALYSTNQIVESISPYEVKAGDFFPAIVETAMNSDLYSKVIVARVTQNIYDTVTGRYLLIPQGTTLTGVYDSNITWGQDRLLVIWQQLRFPNGDMLRLDNMQGVDMIGQAGLPGKVNNHFATLLKGVLLSSAMGAATAITTANDDDDWKSKAGEGAGYSIVQIGDKFASKALERQPTITIKAGDRFNVMVHSNLILKPYK